MTTVDTPDASPGWAAHTDPADPRAWRSLAVLLVGAFMALLDTTIVNVALPTIETGLGGGSSTVEWIVAGFAMAFGLTLIPAGRVGDLIGHRPLFLIGLAAFTAASLACGLAQSPGQTIAFRVVQGLAAGIFFPAIIALIQTMFSGADRGKAFGFLGAVIGASTAAGPLLGGLLIQAIGPANGWRVVFLVNLPLGLIALALAARLLPPITPLTRGVGIDPLGLALLTAALVALLLPLVEGQSLGWPTWTYASLAGSALLLGVFTVWEVRVERRGRQPLVSPRLLRQPAFAAGTLLALVYFAAFTSVFFTLSILWQSGLGRSALETGLTILPFALGTFLAAAASDRFSARLGRGVLILGAAMVAIGLALTLLVLHIGAPSPSAVLLICPLALAGVGNGLFIAPNTDFVLAAIGHRDAGTASGLLSTAQRVGSAVGIAASGAILFGTLHVGHGPNARAAAFTTSAQLAITLNVALVLVALALVFALPNKLANPWG
jgi:EmrB/QacA subfamily drug resistance transporter